MNVRTLIYYILDERDLVEEMKVNNTELDKNLGLCVTDKITELKDTIAGLKFELKFEKNTLTTINAELEVCITEKERGTTEIERLGKQRTKYMSIIRQYAGKLLRFICINNV